MKITIAKKTKKRSTKKRQSGRGRTAEEDAPVILNTHVDNILHAIFSNVEVYINNQQIYNSNCL